MPPFNIIILLFWLNNLCELKAWKCVLDILKLRRCLIRQISQIWGQQILIECEGQMLPLTLLHYHLITGDYLYKLKPWNAILYYIASIFQTKSSVQKVFDWNKGQIDVDSVRKSNTAIMGNIVLSINLWNTVYSKFKRCLIETGDK